MNSSDQQPQTRTSREAPSLARDLADLGLVLRSLFDPYRPERHYMRGPGPRWHAKHDPAPAIVARLVPEKGWHVAAVGLALLAHWQRAASTSRRPRFS